jgi:hypothetical protein
MLADIHAPGQQQRCLQSPGPGELWRCNRWHEAEDRVVLEPRLKLCDACTNERLVEAFQGM